MENNNPNRVPITPAGGSNELVDAKGKPRTLQQMPDGTYVSLSKDEYNEEMQSRMDDLRNRPSE